MWRVILLLIALPVMTAAGLVACARRDPPPGSPAEAAPCPEDAGTELPPELACCLIQARNAEEAQLCLAKAEAGADAGH